MHSKDKLKVYVCISLLDIRVQSLQLLDSHASNVALFFYKTDTGVG